MEENGVGENFHFRLSKRNLRGISIWEKDRVAISIMLNRLTYNGSIEKIIQNTSISMCLKDFFI